MQKFTLIASLAASLAIGTQAQATQFVVNGDFSSLSNGLGQLGFNTNATGWSTSGYNFVMNAAATGSNGVYGNLGLWDGANGGTSTWNGKSPTSGNYVAMDGDFSTAPVTQTISGLTVGQSYTLSFDYAFAQQTGFTGDTTQHISVSFGSSGTPAWTSTDYSLPSQGFSGWSDKTLTLTATSQSEVLSFLAYGNLPIPPFALLTDVSLTGNNAVPEPASWGMMIIGLGVMGLAARRRRGEFTRA